MGLQTSKTQGKFLSYQKTTHSGNQNSTNSQRTLVNYAFKRNGNLSLAACMLACGIGGTIAFYLCMFLSFELFLNIE